MYKVFFINFVFFIKKGCSTKTVEHLCFLSDMQKKYINNLHE